MQTRMRWGVAAGFALLTSLADAAELPLPEVYQTRPAVVIFRWTGFYAGLHAGGGGGSINEGPLPFTFGNSFLISLLPPIFVGGPSLPIFVGGASLVTPLPFDVGVSGWLAGGQVGANYQSENFVIGIEAQVLSLGCEYDSGEIARARGARRSCLADARRNQLARRPGEGYRKAGAIVQTEPESNIGKRIRERFTELERHAERPAAA
jgi:hypothetical protein